LCSVLSLVAALSAVIFTAAAGRIQFFAERHCRRATAAYTRIGLPSFGRTTLLPALPGMSCIKHGDMVAAADRP
jgi:uncharacterized membrane protein